MVEPINYNELYKTTKDTFLIKSTRIKENSLYNIVNTDLPFKFVDFRSKVGELNEGSVKGTIHSTVENYNIDFPKIGSNTRVIVILNEEWIHLEKDEYYQQLRELFKQFAFNIAKIYTIEHKDYGVFMASCQFLFSKSLSSDSELILAKTLFPLSIIPDMLYSGGFMNSRNLMQLNALGIRTLIGFTQPDNGLKNQFKGEVMFFPVDEEKHDEIEFSEIVRQYEQLIENKEQPVLVYCFSGKTVSLAVCIAILMKIKKMNLLAATAQIMKINKDFKLPNWIYSQLQRWKY